MEKLTILPLIAESKETDQDFSFWDKAETWNACIAKSREAALKSFDDWEAEYSKLTPFEKRARMSSRELLTKCNSENRSDQGHKEAVNLILNEVRNGNPPIDKLSGNCQLEFKFL